MPKANSDSSRPIGAVRRSRLTRSEPTLGSARFWNGVAIALGVFFTLAGVMHFVNPSFFDAIVPPWLGPSERFWTYASGIAELVVGPLLLIRRTRRWGALAAIAVLIAVYPANLYMVWDWRERTFGERFISWVRLPLQFVFIWLAWMVSRSQSSADGS
ncbi:MAG: MauE/DoxX family redox-associated membrane protein [Acidimicrobiales bacterium]